MLSAQHTLPPVIEKVPPKIRSTCRQYLWGGSTVKDWTVDIVCELIRNNSIAIRTEKVSASQAPSAPPERCRNLGGQAPTSSPITSPAKRPALQSNEPAAPPKAGTVTQSITDPRVSELEVSLGKAQSKLTSVENQLAVFLNDNHFLRLSLVRNNMFEMQPPDASSEEQAMDLRRTRPTLQLSHIRVSSLAKATALADHFTRQPMKPLRPFTAKYPELLWETARFDESDMEKAAAAKRFFEIHMPWGSALLRDLLTKAAPAEVHQLIATIEIMVTKVWLGTGNMHMDPDRFDNFPEPVVRLRGVVVYDFVSVLLQQTAIDSVSKDGGQILPCREGYTVFVLLRTKAKSEYIWIRKNGPITLFQHGLDMTLRKRNGEYMLYIWPKGGQPGPQFCVDDDTATDYIDKYYVSGFNDMTPRFKEIL